MSGNSILGAWRLWVILAACVAATGSSCNRKVTRPIPPRSGPTVGDRTDRGSNPGRDVPKEGTSPADSLDLGLGEEPVVLDAGLPVGREGAHVALMMPFFSSGYTPTTGRLPNNSDWGLSYYSGLKLGLEALELEGERARLDVFDTQGDDGVAQRLIADPELRDAHVVIGPYLTTAVRAAAVPAKAAGLPFVVPFSAAANLADEYPRLVQLNPSLRVHLDAMATFLTDTYDAEQVVLVGLPTGEQDQELRYLNYQHRTLAPSAPAWRTWTLNTAEVGLQDLDWEDKFVADKQTVFVFPVYRQPGLVLSFMSQLQIARGPNAATVMGMPQWSEFEQLDASILEDLNVMITSGFFVDPDDGDVQDFESAYLARYGTLPQLPAFLGYDAIRLSVPLANKYGRAWVDHLPADYDGLVSDYRIQPVLATGNAIAGEEGKVERLENRAIEVLVWRNYAFRRMD